MTALAVFGATLLADLAWASYIGAVSRGAVLPAALWSAGIVAIGVVTTRAVVKSGWYVLPAGLGAAVGTVLAMQ